MGTEKPAFKSLVAAPELKMNEAFGRGSAAPF
jgi:hypothetical protein